MRHIYLLAILLATLLATSCADDDRQAADTIPDGYGRLAITISTPEVAQTRAVNTTTPWLEGTTNERAIQSYHLLVCDGNTIIDAISGGETALGDHEADPKNYFPSTETITTNLIPKGTYDFTIYCLANFTAAMVTAAGLTVDGEGKVTNTTLPENFEKIVMQPIANGLGSVPTTGLPMTGKLTQDNVSIGGSTTIIEDPLILWRMMAKLEFQFTNETSSNVKVLGIEVEPINQATAANGSGVYLISQDNLFSINNQVARTKVTATWKLHDNIQTEAIKVPTALFAQAQLSYSMLTAEGQTTAGDGTKLQKFQPTEKVTHEEGTSYDGVAAITLTVQPINGLSFTPKKLSFTACRGGTNGGCFDVVEISNGTSMEIATKVKPERYNESPFVSKYNYNLNSASTADTYSVIIYLYDLDTNKDYAFSDFVIMGDVKNTGEVAVQGVTLPWQALEYVGRAPYVPSTALQLAPKNDDNTDEGNLSFYVNETDATFTTIENQLSVRIKLARWNSTANAWYDDEIRFGLTTPYIDGSTGGDGFNVIRRNDWIHIPVHIRDWQFRIEPVAFVPIAGYPATMLSSDALTATFSTGGYIILQPFAQKNNDGTWRDFSDSEVTFVSMTATGDTQMFETAPAYDATTQRITGILRNNLSSGTYKTTLTVNVKLGPSGSQQDYSFTCNVVLQK